jgi:hypothetical protein
VSDFHIFWRVTVRDPYLLVGLLLIGVSSVAWWFMYRKLGEMSFKGSWNGAYVAEYARTRAKYGWPAWPLHAIWVGLLIGIPFLLVGVSKL